MTDRTSALQTPVLCPWHAAGRGVRAALSRGVAFVAAVLLVLGVAVGSLGHAAASEPQAPSRADCASHAWAAFGGASIAATHADAATAGLAQPAGHELGARDGIDAETVEEIALPAASVASLPEFRGSPLRPRSARCPLLVLPMQGRPPNG